MIDNNTIQDVYSFKLDSDDMNQNISSEGSNDQTQKNSSTQPENVQSKDDMIKTQKLINFDSIISQNLSSIYESIATDPSKSLQINETQQNNNFLKKNSHNQVQNLKLLLPVNSNLQKIQKASKTAQNSLKNNNFLIVPTLRQKSKTSRNLTQKIQQKQNIQVSATTFTQKHVRIKSEKIIKYFPQEQIQSSNLEQRNPQSSFDNVERLFNQLSQQFQYVGDFSLVRKEIVQLAMSKKYIIMQNTNQFVTIKVSSKLDYCQCLLKSCLSFQQSGGIYQLKNSLYKRNKAKFILVNGSQTHFLKFFRKLLFKLWDSKKLKLKQKEIVEFFVDSQKEDSQMKQLKKQYTKLYNQLSGLSAGQKSEPKGTGSKFSAQSIISGLTQNLKRFRSPEKIKKGQSLQDKYNSILQFNKKINKKYIDLRIKLLQSQNLPDVDQQYLQKQLEQQIYFHEFPAWKLFGFHFQQDYNVFTSKRQEILKTYSLRKIFQYLQIEQQYSLFCIKKQRLRLSQKQICQQHQQRSQKEKQSSHAEKVRSCSNIQKNKIAQQTNTPSSILNPITPYQQCIKLLEQMNKSSFTPIKLLTYLEQFYKQLQLSYSELYSQKPMLKLSSMDDQLPLTIFIVLMSELSNRSIAMNFIGKLKWLMKWIQYQQIITNKVPLLNQKSQKGSVYGKEGFQLERKILTTLQAAFVFVIKQWKFQQQNTK